MIGQHAKVAIRQNAVFPEDPEPEQPETKPKAPCLAQMASVAYEKAKPLATGPEDPRPSEAPYSARDPQDSRYAPFEDDALVFLPRTPELDKGKGRGSS